MIEYTNVCELIGNYKVNKDLYNFSMTSPGITKHNVLDMVDEKTLSTLYTMADNNNYWLEQILNGNDKILSKNIVDFMDTCKDVLYSQLKLKSNIISKTNVKLI